MRLITHFLKWFELVIVFTVVVISIHYGSQFQSYEYIEGDPTTLWSESYDWSPCKLGWWSSDFGTVDITELHSTERVENPGWIFPMSVSLLTLMELCIKCGWSKNDLRKLSVGTILLSKLHSHVEARFKCCMHLWYMWGMCGMS